jgi:hypothetical protein
MIARAILGAALCAAVTGCTHHQLTRSAVLTTGTVMDIQYRTVLTNLAMLSCHPEALPSHVDLVDGVVQVNDEAAFGTSGGFTTTGSQFGIERYGPSGRRQVSEQWGTEAVTDPQRLTGLQDLYRVAMGLPPLPPPNVVAYLRHGKAERHRAGGVEGAGRDGGLPSALPEAPAGERDSGPSSGSNPSGEDGGRSVPIEVLLSDVPPPGWFHLGGKRDVPKDACYVGRSGDRYAWVTPEGMPGLARFTVTALAAVKLEPGRSRRRNRGLTFTP